MSNDENNQAIETHENDGFSQDTRKNNISNIIWIIVVISILGAIGIIWFRIPISRPVISIFTSFIAFIGIYPLTYLAYKSFRERAHRKRLKDDFRLLGLVSEEELDETVENLYLTVYSPTQFAVYISLIVVFSIVVLAGFLSQQVFSFADKNTITLVFYIGL